MPVRLVATQLLRYAGQLITPGEVFTPRSSDDARVLKALRRAVDEPVKKSRTKGVATAPLPPLPPPPPTPEPVVEPVVPVVVDDVSDDESVDDQ